MPAALGGESESGFHRRRDWCGIGFSMLLFIPQNYRSNAAVRCIGHRSVLQRLMQCAALGIAAHCVFFVYPIYRAEPMALAVLIHGLHWCAEASGSGQQKQPDQTIRTARHPTSADICNTRKQPAEWPPRRSWPVIQHLQSARGWPCHR